MSKGKTLLILTMLIPCFYGMACSSFYDPSIGLRKYKDVSGKEFMNYYNQYEAQKVEWNPSFISKYKGTIGKYYVIDVYYTITRTIPPYQFSARTKIDNLRLVEQPLKATNNEQQTTNNKQLTTDH